MPIDVFMSVGRAATSEQELFLEAVERCLLENDLRPRSLGRSDWSSVQPLTAIHDLMAECQGTVVVAFERTRIEHGVDIAEGGLGGLSHQGLPTVWNQIEASMAYTLGHPLLVIVQDGLRSEGLLEARYDWMVQWLPLEPQALRQPQCVGIIDDWKRRIETRRAGSPESRPSDSPNIADKTVAELLGALKPAQLWAVIAALGALLGAAFWLGTKVG